MHAPCSLPVRRPRGAASPARRRGRLAVLLAGSAAALLAGCGRDSGAPPLHALRELPTPAGEGSQAPHLTVAPDGRVLLSWLEADGAGHALRFAEIGEAPGPARTIVRGDDFFANWADIPSIVALPDGRLAAHWLARSGDDTYAYDVRITFSGDGGATWSAPLTPHDDGTQTEHGFVSLFPVDGGLGAVWLDGRDYARPRGEGDARPEMALRYAAIRDGAVEDEAIIDRRVCDCCATGAAPLPGGGVLVVYRDRSAEEIRDIAAAALRGGRWEAPFAVRRDGWHIEGCPVNGPALAGDGDRVAVAWYTGAGGEPRVWAALGGGDGALGEAVRVDDGAAIGRAAVTLLPDGAALVVWLERTTGDAAEIRARRVTAGGAGASMALAATSGERLSGFPRVVRSGDVVYLAWTDAAGPRVRVAAARLDGRATR
jgi:hypothetical protein